MLLIHHLQTPTLLILSSIGVVLGRRSESSRRFGLGKQVILEFSTTELRSPLFGILAPLFGQLLCEVRVESLDGREWGPVPLSDPSDIELVRGGLTEWGAGNCCRLLP